MLIIAASAGIVLLAAGLWWLLITTEGVYLGRGVVIGLYDLYASRYDGIKQFDAFNEDVYLARPILDALPHVRAPLVLDVATGTGRLPLALLEQPHFQGRIVALDLSRKMLAGAAHKLAPFGERVRLLHHTAEALPFPDDTFDLVTCLEALEFMPRPRVVLRELVRVLRPGGMLVTTNRQGARLMPGKTYSHARFERMLRDDLGLTHIDLQVWTTDYRLVWALKPGHSHPTGPVPLGVVWMCPACRAVDMVPVQSGDRLGWRCLTCETLVPLGDDRVIEAQGVVAAARNAV